MFTVFLEQRVLSSPITKHNMPNNHWCDIPEHDEADGQHVRDHK